MGNKFSFHSIQKELQLYRFPKMFLGGFWRRLFAYLFDLVMIMLLQSIILNLTINRFGGQELRESLLVTLIKLIIFTSYFFFTTKMLEGQTPGKVLFGLKVIPTQSNELSPLTLFIREGLGRVLFFYFPYVAVFLIFSNKRQHVIDMLVDTTVIEENRLLELTDYIQKTEAK